MGCVCEKERSKLVFGLRTAAAGESRVAMLFVSPGLTCLQQFLWPGGLRGWLASAVESPTSRRGVANKVFSYNGDTAVGTQPATANGEGDGDEVCELFPIVRSCGKGVAGSASRRLH